MREIRTVCKPVLVRAREVGMTYRQIVGIIGTLQPKCRVSGMTGDDLRKARIELGRIWELGRPANAAELGRALRLSPSDPGQSVRDYERKRAEPVPGPVAVAVEFMLMGIMPRGGVRSRVVLSRKRA